jgi:hypothetical protein
MQAAGAKKEEVKGDAWNVYEDWATLLGEVKPMIQAIVSLPLTIRCTSICPPHAFGIDIMNE